MGVDLRVVIIDGYVFPQSVFNIAFWNDRQDLEIDDIEILTQKHDKYIR